LRGEGGGARLDERPVHVYYTQPSRLSQPPNELAERELMVQVWMQRRRVEQQHERLLSQRQPLRTAVRRRKRLP
jgi:hypothetical protein